MNWRVRETPLPIVAAVARGEAASRYAKRLLALSNDQLHLLRGAAQDGLIVVAGDDLPWIDGIEYLGREDELYLPTTLAPDVPVPLLVRAITLRHPDLAPPFAMIAAPEMIVSLAALRGVERDQLKKCTGEGACASTGSRS